MSATEKVQTIAIGEDEAGMRLDRWFRRRYPDLPQTHLNKIVRKGEVRVDGKKVEISTRLEIGHMVRVPPLALPAKPTKDTPAPPNPEDARFLRDLILFEDRDVIVFNKPYGLAVQGGSGTKRHIDGMLASLADKKGERPVLVHRLDRDRPRRDLPLARRQEDLLGAGRGNPQAGERAHLDVPRQGRGHGRRARRGEQGPC